jgi:hypothetical protein
MQLKIQKTYLATYSAACESTQASLAANCTTKGLSSEKYVSHEGDEGDKEMNVDDVIDCEERRRTRRMSRRRMRGFTRSRRR